MMGGLQWQLSRKCRELVPSCKGIFEVMGVLRSRVTSISVNAKLSRAVDSVQSEYLSFAPTILKSWKFKCSS